MRERGWRECQKEKDHELEEIELQLKEDGERIREMGEGGGGADTVRLQSDWEEGRDLPFDSKKRQRCPAENIREIHTIQSCTELRL